MHVPEANYNRYERARESFVTSEAGLLGFGVWAVAKLLVSP